MGDRFWKSIVTGNTWNSSPDLSLENIKEQQNRYKLVTEELKQNLSIDVIDKFLNKYPKEARLLELSRLIEEVKFEKNILKFLEKYRRDFY